MRRRAYPDAKPGQRQLSARDFNDAMGTVEAVARIQASRGVRLSTSSAGIQLGGERPLFRARLTALAGGQYSWVEVIENGTGGWTTLADGRAGGPGNWPAYEDNDATVNADPSTGAIVELRPGQAGEYYMFQAPAGAGGSSGGNPNDVSYFRIGNLTYSAAQAVWGLPAITRGQWHSTPGYFIGNFLQFDDVWTGYPYFGLWAVPFPTPRGGKIDRLGVGANPADGGFVGLTWPSPSGLRLGLYEATDWPYYPSSLVVEGEATGYTQIFRNLAGTLETFHITFTLPIEQTLQAGRLYWLAVLYVKPGAFGPSILYDKIQPAPSLFGFMDVSAWTAIPDIDQPPGTQEGPMPPHASGLSDGIQTGQPGALFVPMTTMPAVMPGAFPTNAYPSVQCPGICVRFSG